MRILITNDDGYNAEGILRLADWAKKIGDVTIVAPKIEQSGKSQAIEFHKPFEVRRTDDYNGIPVYYVDSTPADCIRFASAGLNMEFDLVFSGINRGVNVGDDILYSGTVGAIFEGVVTGANAIAFSTDPSSFDDAIASLDKIYEYFKERKLFDYCKCYNVNIPLKPKGIKITKHGNPYYKDTFQSIGNNMYMAKGYSVYNGGKDLTKDIDATMNGYISVSPMTTTRSDDEAYKKLIK